MENVVIKPLGQVLEQAGLISDLQILTALEIQSEHNKVKFGTILVKQGILKQKTINFFAEQLPELLQQPTTQPLGYYLQEAALIDAQQIETLLEEQKQTGILLGELAVEEGLLREKTLNFFLKYFGQKEKKVKLLPPSQQEIIKSFNLETKAASPSHLLQEVFFWTGGHPLLTRKICEIISNSNDFILTGIEPIWVDKLVQDHLVSDWETKVLGEYFKTIQKHLLQNQTCLPKNLLKLYSQILQQQEVYSNQSQEKDELINLGLLIEQENQLKVANRIYQSIFNLDWVEKQLSALEKKSQITVNKVKKTTPDIKQALTTTEIKNEPLTKIAAWISALGLLLISPLVIFFNNSQYKFSQENDSLDSQSLSSSTFCIEPIPAEEITQENWRSRLEQEQQRLQEKFPDNCQSNLDKLIVLNAIELGKENRVIDGINSLCKIRATSKSFNEAKFWLSRWYDSAYWGEETQLYLNSMSNCPAAKNFPQNP